MTQQRQTLNYFSSNADDWQKKATQKKYSVIDNRHAAVLAAIKRHGAVKRFLDVGCGTGQLVLEVSELGVNAEGIDFSSEMIARCEVNKGDAKLPAKFSCDSFFDVSLPESSYDVISAQGFIEYISLEELDIFFATCFQALTKGGSLALGSRNRLFNIHSLNEFTLLELNLNTEKFLLAESVALQTSLTQDEAIANLRAVESIYPQPEFHPITGIKVDTRYQFSPGDLMTRMRKHGFKPAAVYPVHFHGFPLSTIKEDPMASLHKDLAELILKEKIYEARYVPFSSSFVIEARK
jgi:2-polyprenyl-3-methyl-5-hydroxy-6-metoxy-1,4-benzoquinol methylase